MAKNIYIVNYIKLLFFLVQFFPTNAEILQSGSQIFIDVTNRYDKNNTCRIGFGNFWKLIIFEIIFQNRVKVIRRYLKYHVSIGEICRFHLNIEIFTKINVPE